MTCTIKQLENIWLLIDRLYAINQVFPPMWEVRMAYNYKIFEPVIAQLRRKTEEERELIEDEEIELPVSLISTKDLPKNVIPGTVSILKPLFMDYEEVSEEELSKLDIDSLLNPKKDEADHVEGKTEEVAD